MTREVGVLLEEVIAQGNDTAGGLAHRDWTKHVGTALAVTHTLSSGSIRVNTMIDSVPPLLLGGYKVSDSGRELDSARSEGFTQQKTVKGHLSQQGREFP